MYGKRCVGFFLLLGIFYKSKTTVMLQTSQSKKKSTQPSIAALFSRQSSVENFSRPVEPASTAPLADPVVSTEPTNAPRTPDEDENVEGMALNPHWVANGGKQPDNWRHFSALIKYHRTDMKCFEFDVVNGGKVRCVACCSFPVLADKSAKLCREEGYFGQKNGYKWEFFKAHLNS